MARSSDGGKATANRRDAENAENGNGENGTAGRGYGDGENAEDGNSGHGGGSQVWMALGLVAIIVALGLAYAGWTPDLSWFTERTTAEAGAGTATAAGLKTRPPNGDGEGAEDGTATADTKAGEEGDEMADWTVSGAGDSSYNGDYTNAGTHNGKAYYIYGAGTGTRYLCWDDPGGGDKWLLCEDLGDPAGSVGYSGTGATLPANPWSVEFAAAPAPTVAAAGPSGGWAALHELRAQAYVASASNSIAAIRVLCRKGASGSGSGTVQAALYDASYNLIATTQEGTASSIGDWVELQFSGTYPTLTNGTTYYLAAWSPYAAADVACTDGVPSDGGKTDETSPPPTYDTWPDPITLEAMSGSYEIEPVVGSEIVGDYHHGAYSVGAPDSPVTGGQLRGGYSVGVQGSHAGAYSTGEGGKLAGARSVGEQGSLKGAYSTGEGGELRGAYSPGPEYPLEGQQRGAYSVGQALTGSLNGAYSVGGELGGRLRGARSVGEANSGSLDGAYSIGGPAASDEFDVLDLIILR